MKYNTLTQCRACPTWRRHRL